VDAANLLLPICATHQEKRNMSHPEGVKSMKLRPLISGLFGVVAFASISSTASAASSSMTGLARSDVMTVTKVAQRHHYASQARNSYRGGSRNQSKKGSDGSRTTDWYPHDPNELPFGSTRWWQQIEEEKSGSRCC
jgi:hypothetical protein